MAKITKEIEAAVLNDIKAGISHRRIARHFGIGVATVSRVRNGQEKKRYNPLDTIEVGATADTMPDVVPTAVGVVSNDWQIPFQDDVAVELFFGFCQREQPDFIDLNGDIIDFYQISKFDKNPARKNNLQDDIDETVGFFERLRHENPKAHIYYEMGNHEQRLRKLLWSARGQELAGLECLRFENLLSLYELGIILIEKHRKQGDLYITHGTKLSQHAGYSAKLQFEKYGVTMIHGHSHRDGKFTRRTLEGHKCVWENYCLCKIDDVEYLDFANWVQGFSKVTMVGDRPYVEQIPIIGKQYIYGGKTYKAI